TSEENTVYFGSVLPEFQPRLLDLLCDMMRPSLRTEDFEVEKNVILEEIALYQDRPQHTVFEILRRIHFGEHSLGNSVLGSIQSITDLTRDQMHGYFSRRYVPGNMTFVLVGNYEWDRAVEQVETLCARWESVDAGRNFAPCQPRACVHVVTDPRLNRAHLAFAAPGVSAQDPRRRAADTVSEILGGPRGSRLYWALVEPGLADVAQLFHDEEDGSGWFGGYVSCDPANVEEVRSRCLQVLADAAAGNIRPEEVARVTRKNAAGHVISSETPMGRLTTVGFDWIYRKQVESVDEEADATLRISADDCNALMSERPFESLTTVALGPLDATLSATAGASPGDGERP
ncbi:MAG: insulinase family protein, partial [Chloroflexi bacterium]|nr:insulinase family protein [Chloroflexota bacterium]